MIKCLNYIESMKEKKWWSKGGKNRKNKCQCQESKQEKSTGSES